MTLQEKEIFAYKKKRLTWRALRNAASLVAQAHDEMCRFLRLTEAHSALLSDS